MRDVSVIIATYGDIAWSTHAAWHAYPSVVSQTHAANEIFLVHGPTLHQARNAGAAQATSDYLIFLDADDALEDNYIEAMLAVDADQGDIRYPATIGVVNDLFDDAAVLAKPRDLRTGNYITIGAMINRMDFLEVGGFEDLPCLEDWDLFLRLWLAGCDIVGVPEAVYQITVHPGSRNQDEKLHTRTYQKIRRKYQGCSRISA